MKEQIRRRKYKNANWCVPTVHLYSSLDCDPATGGDFKAEVGECVVMDGPDGALFGAFQVICS